MKLLAWYPLQSENHSDYKTSPLGHGDDDIAGIPPGVVKEWRHWLAAVPSSPLPVARHTVRRPHHLARWAADNSDRRSDCQQGRVNLLMQEKQKPEREPVERPERRKQRHSFHKCHQQK
jgi:hypothetical protein